MKLFELAFACRVYEAVGDYDASIKKFHKAVGPALDVRKPAHRSELFVWLRSWGCRQFAIGSEEIAGRSLVAWADRFLPALPAPGAPLRGLSPSAIREVATAYDDLRGRTASRQIRHSSSCAVRYGPAGAAKTLFALRPHSLPPWDDPIRNQFGDGESAEAYVSFLLDAQRHLEEVLEEARRFGIAADDLPSTLGRPDSSLAKLVDEFAWVTVTNECRCPDRNELERWLLWAKGK